MSKVDGTHPAAAVFGQPRLPFRLNGAALRASPGSTPAGPGQTPDWRDGAE